MLFSQFVSRRCVFLLLFALLIICSEYATAQLREAPMNPEFLAARQRPVTRSTQGNLGFTPPPVDYSYLTGRQVFRKTRAVYPTVYDLRTLGRVTPVRDQNPLNTCWTFGSYASVESCLLPGQSYDFSEINMATLHGFDLSVSQGGSQMMATAYLARWGGPVRESLDPYRSMATPSPVGLAVEKHVQDVAFIPKRGGSLDNDNIKYALMNYGALYTAMQWTDSAMNYKTDAFYYSGSVTSNHAVAIVGWDDTYSRTNFLAPPPGDGAFIVRNSWGTGFGQNGYFYVSYYDTVVGDYNALFYGVEEATNYARNYQYDPLGQTSTIGFGTSTGWFANRFTSVESEQVAAASWYTGAPNSSYELFVYVNPTNGPISTTPAARQTGIIELPGYHTLKIATPVLVSAGQTFSVVVKLTTPGYNYPIPLERQLLGYTSAATASAGQSYTSSTGTTWADVTKAYPNSNVCLKAFTREVGAAGEQPDLLLRNLGEQTYLGEGVVNLTDSEAIETWQTKAQQVRAGSTATYQLKLKNDGNSVETFTVTGMAGGTGWTVRYFNSLTGVTNITTQVTDVAGWQVTLAGQQEIAFRVEVTPGTSVTAGAAQRIYVTASSSTDTEKTDTAGLQTGVTLPIAGVSLTASPGTSAMVNSPVTLTATITGGTNVEYLFMASNGRSRTTLREYATAKSYAWTPTSAGPYTLIVWAREVGSPSPYDVVASRSFTVTPSAALAAAPPTNPVQQPVGALSQVNLYAEPRADKLIKLTATPTGGKNVEYRFRVGCKDRFGAWRWSDLTGYTTSSVCYWQPMSAGTYMLTVLARERGSVKAYEVYRTISYTVR